MDGADELARDGIELLQDDAAETMVAFAMVPLDVHQPFAAVLIVKKGGVKPDRMHEYRFRPGTENVWCGAEKNGCVLEGLAHSAGPDIGMDQPELAVVMGERWRPDAAGIDDAAQIEL
jgi:hypothetical protein